MVVFPANATPLLSQYFYKSVAFMCSPLSLFLLLHSTSVSITFSLYRHDPSLDSTLTPLPHLPHPSVLLPFFPPLFLS